jgi:hypothetical protein
MLRLLNIVVRGATGSRWCAGWGSAGSEVDSVREETFFSEGPDELSSFENGRLVMGSILGGWQAQEVML